MSAGSPSSRNRLLKVLDAFQTTLWPVPTLFVVIALGAGVGMPALDAAIADSVPSLLKGYLFGGDAGAARDVLGSVSGSMITVTSLTFSLTVVTLQLASSQFSPRLLRTFSRDRQVQVTLGIFLGTFVYALTVMRTVRDAGDADDGFVPALSVTLAYVLTIASVLALVFFLAHLVRQIRVEAILTDVRDDALATIDRTLPERTHQTPEDLPTVPRGATPVLARSTGFLAKVDHEALVGAAERAGAVVVVDACPGDWVDEGTPVAQAWPAGDPLETEGRALDAEALADDVAGAIVLFDERGGLEDVTFGLRQLVDVAAKALSPGVNDPTTAVHACGHIGTVLRELATREDEPVVLRAGDGPDGGDEDAGTGAVRAMVPRRPFAETAGLGLDQVRSYGASDPQVLAALLQVLRSLAWSVPLRHLPTVSLHLDRTRDAVEGQGFDDEQVIGLQRTVAIADEVVAHRQDGGRTVVSPVRWAAPVAEPRR